MGEPVDVLDQPVRVECFEARDDGRVKGALLIPPEAAVGHLMGQGVLERVREVRDEASLVDELRRLEPLDGPRKVGLGQIGDRLEQRIRYVLADDGGRLKHLLVFRRKLVDAGRQHRAHSRWNRRALKVVRRSVRATYAHQGAHVDEAADALLEEERIAPRPFDQKSSERLKGDIVADEATNKRLSAHCRQRMEVKLCVGRRAAAPAVPKLRAIADEDQESSPRQARDQSVEERLGPSVDPVKILDGEQHRLCLAHAEHKAPERIQRSLPPLGRLKHLPLRIGAGRVEQDQKRREVRRERGIEDEKLGRHLLRHGGGGHPARRCGNNP